MEKPKDKKEAVGSLILRLRLAGITNQQLLSTFEQVPRQNFVPIIHLNESYRVGQMPIECGQFMESADYVARILDVAKIDKGHRVLELGTGSGYQTALLGKLSSKVTSLDRFQTLIEKAKVRLENLNINNVDFLHLDGKNGNPNDGLYDRIISSCAYESPPRQLIDQLTSNGVVIAPIGPPSGVQMVKKFSRIGARFDVQNLFETRLQPFMAGKSQVI